MKTIPSRDKLLAMDQSIIDSIVEAIGVIELQQQKSQLLSSMTQSRPRSASSARKLTQSAARSAHASQRR